MGWRSCASVTTSPWIARCGEGAPSPDDTPVTRLTLLIGRSPGAMR
jgi:hypothetical protein